MKRTTVDKLAHAVGVYGTAYVPNTRHHIEAAHRVVEARLAYFAEQPTPHRPGRLVRPDLLSFTVQPVAPALRARRGERRAA